VHLHLTDRLSCPRCGPQFGLILLAHEVREQRILQGDFGCPNCRDTYPVENGFGDLRAPPRNPIREREKGRQLPEAPESSGEVDGIGAHGLRAAALMGVTEGPGTLLMSGPVALFAPEVARMVEGVEVVAMHPDLEAQSETPGVSRMIAGPGIPFFSATMKAIFLSGPSDGREILEACRVLVPEGRLVLDDKPEHAGDLLGSAGLEVIFEEEGVLIGQRFGGVDGPLVTLRGI